MLVAQTDGEAQLGLSPWGNSRAWFLQAQTFLYSSGGVVPVYQGLGSGWC